MAKYLKAALFTAAYAFIYLFFMLLCQIVLGLTIGGAGKGLTEVLFNQQLAGGAPADIAAANGEQITEAANAASLLINGFVESNTGLIFSISALLSLLAYIQIFNIRKKDIFSVIRMKTRPSRTDVRFGAFAGASANFFISAAVMLLQSLNLFKEAFSEHETHMENTFGSGGLLLTMLGIGIITPVVEEIIFRGMVMYELGRAFPPVAVIIVQGAVFGLFHLVPVQIFYTIPLGIYFGYIAYKSGSVWPAAAGHIAMNAVSILLSSEGMAGIVETSQFSIIFMLFSIYMFVSALIYFIKKKPADISPPDRFT